MKALQKTCPNCIFNSIRVICVYCNKKLGRKQKSYDGMSQFEEEQFSISFDNLQQQKQANSLHQPKIQYKFENQQMIGNKQIVSTNDHPQKQSNNPLSTLYTEQLIPEFSSVNFDEFKINLELFDEYYQMIDSRTKNLQKYFRNSNYSVIDLHKPNMLNKSHFQVRQYPVQTGFKFIFRYQLPCSYSFYMKLNKSTNLVLSLYDKIASFQLLQTVHPNLQILNLEFKKIMGLGMQPRKLTYLKYVNTCNQTHWETCLTIDHQNMDKYNLLKNDSVKQADMFSISHLHQRRLDAEKQEGTKLLVETYMEINLHSVIRAQKIVNKALMEVKRYIDSLYEYGASNYQEDNDDI